MSLTPGTRLGPYEVTAQIGVGGMGEVYRATDTNLARQVAIKVLPAALASDPDRLARFDREAKTLAALNHPNIAQIHGLERSGGTIALVMELVEGPTLADRIADGPIPVDEALPIARQIAEALEAAHEQGIIHRDLKPANVKVRPDGTVKVLDFGLAKAMEPPSAMSPGVSQLPTITTPAMTQAGMILGTAAYMSPEQARGRATDKRSDIWAFGVVLYEMLTARRAFPGEDVTDTIASVVKLEPDWDALAADVPARIRQTIRVCLQKNPQQRGGDMAAIRLALDGMFETVVREPGADGVQSAPAAAAPLWRRALPTVATAVVVGVAALGVGWAVRPADPRPVIRSVHTLPDGRSFRNTSRSVVSIASDGRHLVYSGTGGLYLRAMDALEDRLITGTDGFPVLGPLISPDGESVALFRQTLSNRFELVRLAVTGGAVVVLTETTFPYGATWGEDGTILYGQADGIWQVSENGGEPQLLIATEAGEQAFGPQRLPGGDWVLFSVADDGGGQSRWNEAEIVVESPRSGERRMVRQGGAAAQYVPTGHMVYAFENVLFAVPFDADSLQVTGGAVPVVQGVRRSGLGALNAGDAFYGFTAGGTLAYVPGGGNGGAANGLAWVSAGGEREAIDLPPGTYAHPRVSPDGRWLAVERQEGDGADIWIQETSGTTALRRLTEGGSNRYPVWSRDGAHVAFQSSRDGDRGIFWQLADGTGAAERLTTPEGEAAHIPEDWSPTDDRLAFSVVADGGVELWMWTLADRAATRFATVASNAPFDTVFSPDGRWVAYTQRSGAATVYIHSLSSPESRYLVGRGEDAAHHPLWMPDGSQLTYFPGAGSAVAVDVRTQPTVGFGRPRSVAGAGLSGNVSATTLLNHDVAPDGRFVTVVEESAEDGVAEGDRIVLVQNWFEELTRLVPVD